MHYRDKTGSPDYDKHPDRLLFEIKFEFLWYLYTCTRIFSVEQRRGRGALVERLTASPVMHASRVRTPLY